MNTTTKHSHKLGVTRSQRALDTIMAMSGHPVTQNVLSVLIRAALGGE